MCACVVTQWLSEPWLRSSLLVMLRSFILSSRHVQIFIINFFVFFFLSFFLSKIVISS